MDRRSTSSRSSATPASASTRSCCPKVQYGRRGRGPGPAAHPGREERPACPSATSASRRRSRRPAASSTSRRSARRRPGSRRSSSARSTSSASMEMPSLAGGLQIPEYPGDYFHYVFIEDPHGRPGQRPAGHRRPVREGPRPRGLPRLLPAHADPRLRRQVGAAPRPGHDPQRGVLADAGAVRQGVGHPRRLREGDDRGRPQGRGDVRRRDDRRGLPQGGDQVREPRRAPPASRAAPPLRRRLARRGGGR